MSTFVGFSGRVRPSVIVKCVLYMFKVGIDIGSTTVKLVALDEDGEIVFSKYGRHNARANEVLLSFLGELQAKTGDCEASLRMTGSVGMGLAEKCSLPFVQEVVAATKAIGHRYPGVQSMIDIGGEDAKVVFFHDGVAKDLRMNGNCAGGTGAFIDQMAVILGVSVDELNDLALRATQVHPIASRCGVFCKTDIQNLIAKNVSREDIAASIFHAVAVQTVITLAHGCDITAPVLLCGGPLTFIPALRKAFTDYLSLTDADVVLPENGTLLPAYGSALAEVKDEAGRRLSDYMETITRQGKALGALQSSLPPIFHTEDEYAAWKERISRKQIPVAPLTEGEHEVFLGIDSGSTTTKIVVTDADARLLYSYYTINRGNPIKAVAEGLAKLKQECEARKAVLRIAGSCSTGYGEDLIKAAFELHSGIIETIAHYMAARHLDKEVSFILDIGGQDMKAIFVNQGVIDRIEINEACSSGCGSFVETFAKTLGYLASDFAKEACRSQAPCDLGTRCTVFMNSKVKQALREGATIPDIAAGLAYSVVKNCLYKVLKLKSTEVMGKHIVVQGGTMRNDAIVHAFELLADVEVSRCDIPELMGAFGCALYAAKHRGKPATLDDIITMAHYSSRLLHCKGCDNRCLVTKYTFDNGKCYYSGNKCEKVFTNAGDARVKGQNLYQRKNELLFDRHAEEHPGAPVIGIPRCLNMFEEYPFWHTLLTACGLNVRLSEPSRFSAYERNARMVMSDNICFPAKLVHSHVQDLIAKQVDRIFMPFVIFEQGGKEQNSYNCPIVTGYSEVVKGVQAGTIPIDSPVVNFKDRKMLFKQCQEYLHSLGVTDGERIRTAFRRAEEAQGHYARALVRANEKALNQARKEKRLAILLAGRPYHADPLIQHKIADMMADMGIQVLTDDIVRDKDIAIDDAHFVAQWAYPNRILKAAAWCAMQDDGVQFVEMTSFGCGPDAFLTDEVRDLLMRHHKSLTLLKLDDINNIGSLKLRARSLVESLNLAGEGKAARMEGEKFITVPAYDEAYRGRKILIPFFTPFLSPLLPAVMKVAGYEVENLPISNTESCEWGLKYANNEVCYPATLIVGDIIKAFKSGRYRAEECAIAITQTGGQCRASNYISLIKKALVDAGYRDVPVVSLTFGASLGNDQPAFRMNWLKVLPVAVRAILYSDAIAKFYYATVGRERERGLARRLRDEYLARAATMIGEGRSSELMHELARAAAGFDAACVDMPLPRVGVVGEIFLKFNPFSHRNIIDWLIAHGIEVAPPILVDFFMQTFVNRKSNVRAHVAHRSPTDVLYGLGYRLARKELAKVNRIGSRFRYFVPFNDIFEEADEARSVVSLNAQFGEGWLLPAEVLSYRRRGVRNVISLQPFGCIANHIVAKGLEKRIHNLYPDMNLLSLDFDSGVSDVNIVNRLLLFIDNIGTEVPVEG